MKKIRALHSWIDNLPPDLRAEVLQHMCLRHYRDGETVYRLGEEGHELYMVKSGKVRSCNYTQKGKEIQYIVFQAGDCFGELSLIDGLCRVHSTYALGSTDLLVLHQRDFETLYAKHPQIPIEINKTLSRRLRISHTTIDDATVLPMRDRLARLLGRLAYSISTADEHGQTVLEGFTHENLARMLGSTRESISRELKKLEEEGLLQRRYGKILVPDIAALIGSCDGLVGGESIVPDYNQ
ncbi:MAG: Crp/Fnr family transcriptional regulator [Oceanospirillales bacterium]|nr:Crp/Fnr family transcriptional regulator [Oceanospirillales bacterium]MBR9886769.1 Crp/Fnr family transcriptional regulator [Oceanospirillales bacterium]